MTVELGLTVLVVDDEAPVRDAVGLIVRHAGFAMIEAATCAEALAQVEAQHPDVVLLDVRLDARPDGESGLDLLPLLDAAGVQTPVILFTGRASINEAWRSGTMGVRGVIQKGEPTASLVSTLHAVIKAHGDPLARLIRRLSASSVDLSELHGDIVLAAAAPGTDLIGFRQCARAIHFYQGQASPDVTRLRALLTATGNIRRGLPTHLLQVLQSLAASATAPGGVRAFQISPEDRRDLHRLTGDNQAVWRRYARVQAGLRLVLRTREQVGQISLALGYPHENELARDLRRLAGRAPRAIRELGAADQAVLSERRVVR